MTEQLYQHYLQHPLVCTDTREVKPGAIFFALKGENFNGNKFAAQAISSGCALAVIDEKEFLPKDKNGEDDARYFLVKDVLTALQQLANHHRRQLKIPVISITGSNGKTTSKELLNAVLSQKYKVLATKGNLNNHIGVPLTLLSITAEHEMAIVEMGANHQGEIAMLCEIAEPAFGMITNIGKAHLEGFGGPEGVIKAKNELYQYVTKKQGLLFVNYDNELLRKLSANSKRVTFGTSAEADFKGEFVDSNPFVKMRFRAGSEKASMSGEPLVTTQLIGKYNFENILAAACIGNHFGVPPEQIRAGLEQYVPSNNRSQVMKTKENLLLLDAYNANPSSMSAAIENFAQMDQPKKMLILGDMLELGDDSDKEHAAVLTLLREKKLDNVILTGPHFVKAARGTSLKTFAQSDEVLAYLKEHPVSGFAILIKGSRGIRLEKVVEAV